MTKRVQPKWTPFPGSGTPVLKLYNSLTRQKEVFVPENGKRVTWYSCGPTVYDASHMGHARSYISFDILRRVLTDYFGYDVLFVMNITDVDDKIIKRARQKHLYEEYVAAGHAFDKVLDDAGNVLDLYLQKATATSDPDKKAMMDVLLATLNVRIESLKLSLHDEAENRKAQAAFVEDCKDPLSEWLDEQFGAQIADNNIFKSLPEYWEDEFHKDMDALNVLRPDVLTRVSEYIPEIVEYVGMIIRNGLAYEANGSVYFDVSKFEHSDKHHYAKLVPEAYGDARSLQEGEGDLSGKEQQSEKRAATDFALWKRSKAGEPAWESPWGRGRPGWHIECSAMASAICGATLDIHTGGVDLKFPHHDNEIAQSEAYFESSEWVKYFLHAGHLTIAGCKMSKSLKNFVSIQDALQRHSARQLRFTFLLHSWRDTLDYSANSMEIALQYERMFSEFFLNAKDACRHVAQATGSATFAKCERAELELNARFQTGKSRVHEALCDSVDTRAALEALRDLVAASNLYLRDRKPPNAILLSNIAKYITDMLRIFGAIAQPTDTGIGFPVSDASNHNLETRIRPYVAILADFRDVVRSQARDLKAHGILQECDRLRDDVLPNVGVRLEDRDGEPSAVKMVDRDTLLKERELKQQQELEKQAEKERKRLEQAEKEALRKVPPQEMFRRESGKYSKFDEQGVPTHDADGKEISKGQAKKLVKLWQAQEKRYQDHLNAVK